MSVLVCVVLATFCNMYSLHISLSCNIDLLSSSVSLKLAIDRVGCCSWEPIIFGVHVLGGKWFEVSVVDLFPSVPVLILRYRLGAGECLPGLLIGDRVEWERFDRQACNLVSSIPEAGICGWRTDSSFSVLAFVVTWTCVLVYCAESKLMSALQSYFSLINVIGVYHLFPLIPSIIILLKAGILLDTSVLNLAVSVIHFHDLKDGSSIRSSCDSLDCIRFCCWMLRRS